ncbi:MAG: hypothetical protein ABSA45_01225 [Verrucomicrobiota bacterium]|jgi:hypothetical protein
MGLLLGLIALLVYPDVTQQALDPTNAAPSKNLEGSQQRLRLYRSRQPWRELSQFTSAPLKQ